jgi:hypothetical protein
VNNWAPNLDNERQDIVITDAGRRMSEAHEAARAAGGIGRFIAVRLSDGHCDGDIYDTRDDAIRLKSGFASLYAYVKIQPGQMPPGEATAWIALHQRAADAGMPLTGPSPVLPTGPGTDRLLLPHQHARARGFARILRRDGKYR